MPDAICRVGHCPPALASPPARAIRPTSSLAGARSSLHVFPPKQCQADGMEAHFTPHKTEQRAQRILALLDQIDAAHRFSAAAAPVMEMEGPRLLAPEYVAFRQAWRAAAEAVVQGFGYPGEISSKVEHEFLRQARWTRFEARIYRVAYLIWSFLGHPTDDFEPELTLPRACALVAIVLVALVAATAAVRVVVWLVPEMVKLLW